jgi:hypothetical protein
MRFEINVPEALGDKDLCSFFRGWTWFDDPSGDVLIEVQRGTHIAPWAATLFAAYAIWLKEVRNKNVLLRYVEDSYVGRFLQRIGFPQILGFDQTVLPDSSVRMFPLTRVTESKQIAPIATSLVSMLQIGDSEIEDALKYGLVELLRNVIQHSNSRIGGIVSAVYFPRSGLVDVVVADIGRGIKAALRSAYPEINTDQKAVRFAMLPHVSGTFESGAYQAMKDNAGLGLFFIREIATKAGGGFFLGSGKMLADIWGDENGDQKKRYVEATTHGWRGTFAVLQLRKDSIGEFGALLQRCREIAAEVRKSRSEMAVDFLDEPLNFEGLVTISIKKIEEDVEAAALVRETTILPKLASGELVLLDFAGVRAATQSFIHALMYKVFRDGKNIGSCLTIACADNATEQAIRAVSAYATTERVT